MGTAVHELYFSVIAYGDRANQMLQDLSFEELHHAVVEVNEYLAISFRERINRLFTFKSMII